MKEQHKQYMKRCLELAAKGMGHTSPNPLVGAVIVHHHRIIGEGWHRMYGADHAEINALNSVKSTDRHLLKASTLYVNLEPCNHFGNTPPCSDRIVEEQIPKVVIGCADPYPLVAGSGIEKLRKAGVEVVENVLGAASWFLNRRFFTFHSQKRPYIILKWAQTQDAYFAPHGNEQKWISNRLSKRLAHRWRAEENAIIVGRLTATIDNPQLTVRHWQGNNPIRIVIDKDRSLPVHLNLFDNSAPTIVFTTQYGQSGERIKYVQLDFSKSLIPQLTTYLHQQGVQSLIVEGGATLLNHFIEQNYWDEARVFIAPIRWREGIVAPKLQNEQLLSDEHLGDNRLMVFVHETQFRVV